MSDASAPITVESLRTAIDDAWTSLERALAEFEPVLEAGPDEGGWTSRQLLSHMVGAWFRVPIHTGFYLANRDSVPLLVGDPYWVAEWETAPFVAFVLAMKAGVACCRQLVETLTQTDLLKEADTPFGRMSLGEFLVTSFTGHIHRFHGRQLAAFTATHKAT
ncbi:MAG: hypothetical protein KF716_32800 [Anaerolineae bacterium]|nr:hypothetical protein [Anaerolineae bacterium]